MKEYMGINEGIQKTDHRINFKVKRALACSQGVEKPVKGVSLNRQRRDKYRRDGIGCRRSLSAMNSSFPS